MGFPTSVEDLRNAITARREAVRVANEGIERIKKEEIDPLNKEVETDQKLVEILSGLLSSWREPDPGKGDSYFFVDANNRRAVALELLPEGTEVCRTRAEQDEYAQSRPVDPRAPHTRVPYCYKVVSLNQILAARCGKCGAYLPVIEHYVQTEDSVEGDNWLRERFLLCLDCNLETPVGEPENSEMRLY